MLKVAVFTGSEEGVQNRIDKLLATPGVKLVEVSAPSNLSKGNIGVTITYKQKSRKDQE